MSINGNNGQTIRAAANGTVVYSGSALIGYGELIIIKHNEQWISAYGHNRKRLVNEGQTVKANQPIAEMGRMLYFEIRYNGKPVDPLVYLPRNNTPPAIPSKPVQTSIVLLESAILRSRPIEHHYSARF